LISILNIEEVYLHNEINLSFHTPSDFVYSSTQIAMYYYIIKWIGKKIIDIILIIVDNIILARILSKSWC